MKRVVLAGIGVLAMATMVSGANAADLSRQQAMPVKAPLYEAPFSWTGAYIGINGGYGFGNSAWSGGGASSRFDTDGALIGGTLGYNWQAGRTVFGLEGDADWSDISGGTSNLPCTAGTCETRNNWLATARGRIGYAFSRFMPYITGGLAVGDIEASAPGFSGVRETRAGWTVGGGGEFNISGPWSAKIEYLYVDLGKTNCAAGDCAVSTDVDSHANVVRAGLNYHF